MTRLAKLALVLSASVMFVGGAEAADRGTAAEAQALLAQAVAHYQQAGRSQAIADFNNPRGEFVHDDLYVFCIGPDDKMVAYGANASLVGTDTDNLKDADGKPIGQQIREIGRDRGSGTLDYKFMNPATQQAEPKSTFIQKVGEDVCAVGYYK